MTKRHEASQSDPQQPSQLPRDGTETSLSSPARLLSLHLRLSGSEKETSSLSAFVSYHKLAGLGRKNGCAFQRLPTIPSAFTVEWEIGWSMGRVWSTAEATGRVED